MVNMGMIELNERKVQTWALHYLHSRYQNKFPAKPSFADAEMELKKTNGEKRGRRADGLICFKLADSDFYTISLEAKSIKTLEHLIDILKEDDEILVSQDFKMFALLIIPTLLAAFLSWSFAWYITIMICLGVFAFSLIGVYFYLQSPSFYKTAVHNQLSNYAGNERWIAISEDAWQNLIKGKAKKFKQICKSYDFGLLIVNANGKVDEELPSQIKGEASKHQFLDLYNQATYIKESFLTRQNNIKSYRQCLNFFKRGEIYEISCLNPLSKIITPKLELAQ